MAVTYSLRGQVITPWSGSTAWALGSFCSNKGNLYVCITAGTSGFANGPIGTGSSITDGTVVWQYYAVNVSYPPGTISTLGTNLALQNRAPHITYVGPNGTKFYLAGPLAPTPGAQTGVVLQNIMGLTAPFRHLDNQGARQDGTTWTDTLYEPGEIDMVLEASGLAAADIRALLRSWQGAWNPKVQGRLSVFTPENGEWWARVRQMKNFGDPITYSHENYGGQRFTWAARNDDSFWESFDSVSSFKMALTKNTDSFTGTASTTSLGSTRWSQTYWGVSSGVRTTTGAGAGTVGLDGNGNAHWTVSGTGAREVVNRYLGNDGTGTPTTTNGGLSSTDNQQISVTINAPVGFDLYGGVYFDIWGRMGSFGNGIRARIGGNGIIDEVILSRFTGGASGVAPTETVMYRRPLAIGPLWNEKWTLLCGTTSGARNFKIQRGDGFTVVDCDEIGTNSLITSANRGWGFGMAAGAAQTFTPLNLIKATQVAPPDIHEWSAGDNVTVTQSGTVSLLNRGDVEAFPRYLLYGPGTFTISDGPNGKPVTFGPLLENQLVMLTTLPRLRGVTDLSKTSLNQKVVDGAVVPLAIPNSSNLNDFQKLIKGVIDFATNNNVPPVLEQFESLFGILPPQGPLYSLLNGRFTKSLPAKDNDSYALVQKITVTITDGNADSKIVAAVTPRRRWPM